MIKKNRPLNMTPDAPKMQNGSPIIRSQIDVSLAWLRESPTNYATSYQRENVLVRMHFGAK